MASAGDGIIGKWRYDHGENLDAYFAEGSAWRSQERHSMEISKDQHGVWVITVPHIGAEMKLKTGEVYEGATTDGDRARKISTMEGKKLVTKLVDIPDGEVITREIVDGNLVTTFSRGGVVAKRVYTKES